ncbi:MAG TPA: TonB-dependent receptor plug domain-containing protein, partial [Flavitalea sp.]|nr:TonB-dependent receptor plug domain-containing protein [Flavitalea sp.]
MRNFLFVLALLTGFSNVVFSQRSVITGTVKDQNGGPVIGATVQARGSNVAVVSDETGAFSINAPEGTKVLDISSVGYQPLNFPVSGGTVTAVLKKDESKLSEVVVVGYGQSAKKSVTGAISRISAKEVENQPVQSFESAMQGKSAGVVIDNSSGKVGQGIKVRIRGTSSINASSQPLYVVDGVPLTSESQSDETNEPTNPLIDLNPNDIESIDVLKDAAAAAIYGARASNGVVLITTKKGTRNDKTVVELNTVFGSSNPTKKRKFLDAKQYVQAIRTAALNDAHYDFTNDQDAG